MDKASFYSSVSAFILDHRPQAGTAAVLTEIPPDGNLFDLGLVDSYTMLRLVGYVEDLTGQEIDILNIDIARLFTLEEIYGVVFGTA